MSRSTKWFLALLGLGLVLCACFVIVGVLVTRQPVTIDHEGSVLRIDLSGAWVDSDPDAPLNNILGVHVVTQADLIDSLDKAASDPRVAALELTLGPLEIGWGRATEIRQALERFKASGKPIHGWMAFGDDGSFYLASVADELRMLETGTLDLNGIAAEVPFYGGTLEKLGVQADLEQIAEYKNAADSYKRKDMTEAHHEAVESLVDGLYSELVDTLAGSLDLGREKVEALISAGPYTARGALEAGLIDGVGYEDEAADALDQTLGGGEHERVDLEDHVLMLGRSRGGKRIAVVHCVGDIVSGSSEKSIFGGGSVGSETIAKAIRKASEDDEVAAIVLRIDSPGGSATASDEIWRAAARARETHHVPIVVSMADVAASGGYWIAMGADRIVAEPTTITGSIGVFGGKWVTAGLEQWAGMNSVTVSRGENAAMDSSSALYTDPQRAKLKEQLQAIYRTFLQKAAQGRGFKSPDEVDVHARGRVWTGRQALERGLVDELGGLREALLAARKLAKIADGAPVSLIHYPQPPTFFETIRERGGASLAARLVGRELGREAAASLMPEIQWAASLRRTAALLSREPTLAWLPIRILAR